MARLSGGPRGNRRGAVVVIVLLAVVNLPFLHGAWVGRDVERNGVDVTATVLSSRGSDDGGLVEFRFDDVVDPAQDVWTAALDGDAFRLAESSESVQVRVVPGSPERYRVAGAQGAGVLVALTVFADVVLVIALVLVLRRRPGPLRLIALEDVQRAKPGGSLQRVSGSMYVVTGEVSAIEADVVVIDVGDQEVHVDLAGFSNPVWFQQPARVTCRLPESPA